MKTALALMTALTSVSAFADDARFAAPAVPTGESCQAVTAQQLARGFTGFTTCVVKDFNSENLNNEMTIRYSVADKALVVELTAPTTGWVGFGLGSMSDSDMAIGLVEDATGKVVVQDYFTAGRRFPVLDTENGGTDDILFADGMQENGMTKIRFVRMLEGNGATDKAVTPGTQQRVIFAYGRADDLARHPGGATAAYDFTFMP